MLDTDTIVAAVRSATGATRALIEAAFAGRLTCLVSVPLMIEYEAVLTRSDLLTEPGLDQMARGDILDGILSVMQPMQLAYLWGGLLRDPDDDMVPETAINGAADAIVTFNLRDYAVFPAGLGIIVLRPAEALRRLE